VVTAAASLGLCTVTFICSCTGVEKSVFMRFLLRALQGEFRKLSGFSGVAVILIYGAWENVLLRVAVYQLFCVLVLQAWVPLGSS
jgi:hypothetical protein